MGESKAGDSELIRITLIDYFTSAVLIDSLVYPDVGMLHFRTRFSGISRKDIETAKRRRQCIMGRDNARRAVWRYVGPNTIVVGHSAHNDLTALRWIHPVVVDTFLIESLKANEGSTGNENENHESKGEQDESKQGARKSTEHCKATNGRNGGDMLGIDGAAVSSAAYRRNADTREQAKPGQQKQKGSGRFSLRTLTKVKLGRDIQNAGKLGHDSLEDAIASRDLAHWHVVNGHSLW